MAKSPTELHNDSLSFNVFTMDGVKCTTHAFIPKQNGYIWFQLLTVSTRFRASHMVIVNYPKQYHLYGKSVYQISEIGLLQIIRNQSLYIKYDTPNYKNNDERTTFLAFRVDDTMDAFRGMHRRYTKVNSSYSENTDETLNINWSNQSIINGFEVPVDGIYFINFKIHLDLSAQILYHGLDAAIEIRLKGYPTYGVSPTLKCSLCNFASSSVHSINSLMLIDLTFKDFITFHELSDAYSITHVKYSAFLYEPKHRNKIAWSVLLLSEDRKCFNTVFLNGYSNIVWNDISQRVIIPTAGVYFIGLSATLIANELPSIKIVLNSHNIVLLIRSIINSTDYAYLTVGRTTLIKLKQMDELEALSCNVTKNGLAFFGFLLHFD